MPPKGKALKVGDVVSVPATAFGQEWAKDNFKTDWHKKKLQGTVMGKGSGALWQLTFPPATDNDESMDISLARKDITFVNRPEADPAAHVEADDEESSDEEPEKPLDAVDSSEDDVEAAADAFFAEEPDHEVKTGKKDSYKKDMMADWKRDDGFCFDQRAKVTTSKDKPKLKTENKYEPTSSGIFDLGCLFLPMTFLTLMAAEMTTIGKAKRADGDHDFPAGWEVSQADLLQWIGVWMYMLAFPQPAVEGACIGKSHLVALARGTSFRHACAWVKTARRVSNGSNSCSVASRCLDTHGAMPAGRRTIRSTPHVDFGTRCVTVSMRRWKPLGSSCSTSPWFSGRVVACPASW